MRGSKSAQQESTESTMTTGHVGMMIDPRSSSGFTTTIVPDSRRLLASATVVLRIDLVVPTFPPAHWNFAFAARLGGFSYSHPPLGAITLAAHTPAGVRVRVLDQNVEQVAIDRLAPVVGISAMYVQRESAYALAEAVRASGRTVILGGSLVNALPQRSAAAADAIVHGEAEETWPRVCADVQAGRLAPEYRAAGRFDLSRAAVPRFDLLRPGAYSTASIQTSRGCPFACDYCDVPLLDGRPPRTKSVDQVMREVEATWALGYRSLFFVDDHFLGQRKLAIALLEELARFGVAHRHGMIFYCQATVNLARDPELLELMYRANFRRVFLGIESDDIDALRAMNKGHNTLMPLAEAVREIQRHNIVVWAALLLGFDGERRETPARYIRFAREAGIGMVVPGILQAVPGTAYHRRVVEQGRLVPLRNGYVGGQAGSLDSLLVTNVEPTEMSHGELIAGYRELVDGLYRGEPYGERVVAALSAGERPELGGLQWRQAWSERATFLRVLAHFLRTDDPERRAVARRIAAWVVQARGHRADEAIFHLVAYEHLREFYGRAARASTPLAADLERGSVAHA
jgi:radical SAM superfamily enzyme YgiQ (UPF0313 family)